MANGSDEFNLQLSGELDQNKSKTNINSDLVKIASAIDKLKVQAEIDQNSVRQIAHQLSNIMNQKVVVNNIQIDTNQASKAGDTVCQNISDSLTKRLQSSLNTVKQNIETTIKGFGNQKLNSYDLTKVFNLNRADIDASVIQQIRSLTNELNGLAKEALKKNSDSSWEGIINKISSLSKVLTQFGSGRDLTAFKESLDVLDYFQNKKIFVGNKAEGLANTGLTVKELNNQFRNLGVTFTTVSEGATKLDTVWTELFNISPNMQNFTVFGDQLNAVVEHLRIAKEAMYGDKNLTPLNGHEVNAVLLDWLTNLENVSKKVNVFRGEQEELERRLAQTSTAVANTVVQNEQKKQQAYQQTAKAQSSVDNPDLDMAGNAQKIEQFKESLAELGTVDSKYVDRLSERFENLGIQIQTINASLSEVAVHEKGEYKGTKEILSSTLTGIDKYGQAITLTEAWDLTNHEFVKSLDAVGSSFDNVQKHVTTYQTKLNDLKTKYSNASLDYSGFETALANFQKGIGTIDDLKLAFNELENSAKLGVQSLKSQSSSFDPIQQALNNMRDMPSMLKTLEASMSGIKDKTSLAGVSVKDLTSKYEELQKEMTANGGKIPLTDQWTQDYRELMSTVTSATKQVDALKKTEASDNSQASKQANYYSSILASYRQMYDIKKKLLYAGEEEAKALESQRKSLSASIASNYKQLGKQGLTDKDWQSQVDALKKEQEYQLNLTQARISDKNAIQEQTQKQRDYANALREQEALQKNLDKIQLSYDNGHGDSEYRNRIQSLVNDFEKYGLSVKEAEEKTQSLRDILNGFKVDGNFLPDDELLAQANKFESEFKAVKVSVDSAKLSYDKFLQPVSSEKASSLIIKINDFLSKNKAITKEAKEELEGFVRLLQNGNVNLSDWNKFDTRLKEINIEMREAGRLGKTLSGTLIEGAKSFAQWTVSSFSVMEVVNNIRQGVNEIKELDDILTEINKTSDLTKQQLDKLGDVSFNTASKYGKKASDYLTGVQEMYRAGFDNAKEMAELSVLAQSSGDMESNSANDYLMATNAAYDFKGSVEELNKVLDSQNYITNNAAVSMQDMADATSEAASIASQYGVGVDELSALIAVAVSKTRESGAEVGTALKALLINLQDTTSKPITEAFDAVGISMTKMVDGSEKLKTPIELIKELSIAFNSLPEGDIKRANILNDIGGKHHANTLAAILSDLKSYNSILELYNNTSADGSAFREAEKSANNLSGSLNKLSNTWTDTVENILNSDTLTNGVNVLNSLLGLVNKLTESLGTLGTIGLIGGGILGAKNAGREKCYPSY